tara:strand:+ start:8891 stop:9898 length:1008 start_codon:yes stop_codon:yes gene_type:complete
MEDEHTPTFLGLGPGKGNVDMAVLSLPYELTTSYGQGTAEGPLACIEASSQVELYDEGLGEDLPCDYSIHTIPAWEGTEPTLLHQLDSMIGYLAPWFKGDCFPLCLGGEHGILPSIMEALRSHPALKEDLSNLTVVQIDAHGDLRDELDGEIYSHACVASRALDAGIGSLLQVGIRAFSKEEYQKMINDDRITTYFAKDTQSQSNGAQHWKRWLEKLQSIEGPVHLTIDIDGLDGSLVPATGTPVPGGLSFWQVHETIETLFNAPNVMVVSADINEIGVQTESPLTQFTAAMLATKVVSGHISARRNNTWRALSEPSGPHRQAVPTNHFRNGMEE